METKNPMNEKQFEFVMIEYVKNFLEQNNIYAKGLGDDEINMIFSSSELNPKFSIFLLAQMRALIFDKDEADAIREEFFAKNN